MEEIASPAFGRVYEGPSLLRASELCTAANVLDIPWVMERVVGAEGPATYRARVMGLSDRDPESGSAAEQANDAASLIARIAAAAKQVHEGTTAEPFDRERLGNYL